MVVATMASSRGRPVVSVRAGLDMTSATWPYGSTTDASSMEVLPPVGFSDDNLASCSAEKPPGLRAAPRPWLEGRARSLPAETRAVATGLSDTDATIMGAAREECENEGMGGQPLRCCFRLSPEKSLTSCQQSWKSNFAVRHPLSFGPHARRDGGRQPAVRPPDQAAAHRRQRYVPSYVHRSPRVPTRAPRRAPRPRPSPPKTFRV